MFLKRCLVFFFFIGTFAKIIPKYRLGEDVIPKNYKLDLVLRSNVFETNKYEGTVEIELEIVEDDQKQIRLHAQQLLIQGGNVTITSATNTTIKAESVSESDEESDIFAINFQQPLKKGSYSLKIPFQGSIDHKDMKGFYKSSYEENGKTVFFASSHFEPTSARRAFPCFDEPGLKATFEVSFIYPGEYRTLSNSLQKGTPDKDEIRGDEGLFAVEYERTPPMSTYLLALIVSKFDCQSPIYDIEHLDLLVCARGGENQKGTTKYAGEIPAKILPVMQNLTGFDYKKSGIGKLVSAAIPDPKAGAMNWGLMTFSESDFLLDQTESSDLEKYRVANVLNHEIVHQWFGNLVTMKWWDDLFLNEGLATYFQYLAASQVKEWSNFEYDKAFVVEKMHAVLAADVDDDHQPLHRNVQQPSDITKGYDDIAYNKGGSIVRMLHQAVGFNDFKKGITSYINHHVEQNAISSDLWKAFDDAGIKPTHIQNNTFVQIMNDWVNRAGYPLVKVELKNQKLILNQVRFGGKMEKSNWYIPISYVSSANPKDSNAMPKLWFSDNSLTIELGEKLDWVILNNQQSGFYRIDYDNNLWKKIIDFLKSNKVDSVHELNRAQITDDLFNLAKIGVRSYAEILGFLEFLPNDKSYYTWFAATNGFNYLLSRINDDAIFADLTKFISSHMSTVLTEISSNIDQTLNDPKLVTIKKFNLLFDWACRLNNEKCVKYSIEKFQDFQNKKEKPHRNVKDIVYCNALKNSANISSDWNFLFGKLSSTSLSSERLILLKALGCAKDKKIIENYLQSAIKNSAIKKQEASFVFSSCLSNRDNVDVVLDFVIKNHGFFYDYFGSNDNLISLLSSLGDSLYNKEQTAKLADFAIKSKDDDVKKAAQAAVAKSGKNLLIASGLKSDLAKYFVKKVNNAAFMNMVHLGTLVPTFVLLITKYYY